MSKQRGGQGRDCLAQRSAVVCSNIYYFLVSGAQMLHVEGLVCYKTWPLLLHTLSLLNRLSSTFKAKTPRSSYHFKSCVMQLLQGWPTTGSRRLSAQQQEGHSRERKTA